MRKGSVLFNCIGLLGPQNWSSGCRRQTTLCSYEDSVPDAPAFHTVTWWQYEVSRLSALSKYHCLPDRTAIYLLFYIGTKFGLALRELRGLRMVENVALRKIFGPKRNEVIGDWRSPHIEELNDLYFSPYESDNKIKKKEMGGACSTCGGEERCIRGYGGET